MNDDLCTGAGNTAVGNLGDLDNLPTEPTLCAENQAAIATGEVTISLGITN